MHKTQIRGVGILLVAAALGGLLAQGVFAEDAASSFWKCGVQADVPACQPQVLEE